METFLRRVLPATGKYVAVAIAEGIGVREVKGLPDTAGLWKAAQRLGAANANVYFAVGSYGYDRNTPLLKRSLFLDLDPKEFTTKKNALAETVLFCRTTGFPPPSIVVDSGRGIHVYWTFTKDISAEQWKVLAEALKAKCREVGFKADPAVTADIKRIMRMPGTANIKGDTPVPCYVITDTGKNFDPDALLQALGPVKPSGAIAKLAAMVGEHDLSSGMQGPGPSNQIYYTTEIADRCGVMKEALQTGGRDHSEPHWRHLLSLLTFTEDGEAMAHQISMGHPDYTPESTANKYQSVLDLKAAGHLKPILCTTFETYRPDICAACPHRATIKTPLVLGRLNQNSYLPPAYRMNDYGLEKMIKKDDPDNEDGSVTVWKEVFPYRVSEVEVYNLGEDQSLQVRMLLSSKREVKPFVIDHGLLVGRADGLGQEFSLQHFITDNRHLPDFRYVMNTWLRKMADVKAEVSLEITGLGWGRRGTKHAFVAGARVYAEDGSDTQFIPVDKSLARNYKPKGKIDPWKIVASATVADPRPAAQVSLLTAFASPLVTFTGVKGLTFSLYSAASGTGKSFLLRIAQSVWGHPTSGMAMVNDTENSVIRRFGFLNSIPAYWDELRSGDSLKNFVGTIFTIGQGKEKGRLTSSLKQQEVGQWSTLVTIASNERIVDHVDTFIKNTDAGRRRVFEVELQHLPKHDAIQTRANASLDSNYGHAGVIYGKWLAEHRAEAEKIVHTFQDKLNAVAGHKPSERYWVAFAASILAAAVCVEKAGLLKFDLNKLYNWIRGEYQAQQTGVVHNYNTPAVAAINSVVDFIDSNRDKMLVVDHMNSATGMGQHGNILTPANQFPKGEIDVLKAVKDKKVRLRESAWRTWVQRTMQHSPTTLTSELSKVGVARTKATLTAGIQSASNARVIVLEIDLDHPSFKSLMDDQ